MNEILSAENIIKAYEETGITPIYGTFYGSNNCGCALTALYAQKKGYKTISQVRNDTVSGVLNVYGEELGIDDRDYLIDFYSGFDLIEIDCRSYKNKDAYELGMTARFELEKKLGYELS